MLDNNVEEEDMIPNFAANYNAFFNDTAMGEPEEDTEGRVVEDDLGQIRTKMRKFAKQKRNREIRSVCWRTTEYCCTLIANKTKRSWVPHWNYCNGRHQMVCLTRDSRSC